LTQRLVVKKGVPQIPDLCSGLGSDQPPQGGSPDFSSTQTCS